MDLSDGAVGIAEATPRPTIYGETQASVLHILEKHLAPLLLDREIDSFASVSVLTERLSSIKNNNTAKGALDMAAHQALAQSRGESLAAYLGVASKSIRLSTIVSTGSPAAVSADVEAAYQAGLRVFKVKIGRDVAGETEMLARLIDNYPAAQFYVDANETLDAANAAAILRHLHALGVIHCEEALPVRWLRERRQLRRDCAMPIIADDSAFTLADLKREIDFDTFDILNIKTARSGFSESRQMLEQMCREHGKSVMVGSQASSLLGCLQAAIFAGSDGVNCASECSFYLKTEADLSWAPPIDDGVVEIDAVETALANMQAALAKLV